MPAFDLRHINIAEYKNASGAITYGVPVKAGDAMSANLEMRYAEGRLYAESTLAEYMRKALGGTISLAVKYIPEEAQTLMYGTQSNTRTVGEKQIKSLKTTAKDVSKYVGVSFYAPDMIDGVQKYTCVFVSRALFGAPSMVYQTLGESITFNTPTTTGEFLANNAATQDLLEVAIADTEEDAIAWCAAVFGGNA